MARTVAVDCDGVLVAVHELIDELWAHKGLPFRHDPHVTDFDYSKCVGHLAQQLAYQVFRRPELYDHPDTPLVEGAMAGLGQLRKLPRTNLIAVSTPFAEHAGSKWNFLRRMGFESDEIFLTGDKHSVRWDVLIDDRAETVMETRYPRSALLFDQPWNREQTLHLQHVTRVHSWDEILRALAGW